MSWLGGILFLPVATAIGRALLPSRAALPRSRWEELAASYLLGASLVCVWGTALIAARLTFPLVFWSTLALGAAALIFQLRRRDDGALAPLGWSRPQAGLLGALAVGSVLLTVALPLNEFDPILHFAYRAKILLYQGTVLDEALLGMEGPLGYGRIATHPNYPIGLPILEAWAAFPGGWSDRWVQIPLAFWSASMPAVVALGLRHRSRPAARLGALLVACTPMLYVSDFLHHGLVDLRQAGLTNDAILGGGADLPVAATFTLACALVVLSWRRGSLRLAALAGLAFGGAATFKNEGTALTAVALIAVACASVLRPRPRLRPTLVTAAVCALTIGPWLALRAELPNIDEDYGSQLTLANVMEKLGGGGEPLDMAPPGMAEESRRYAEEGSPLAQRRVTVGLAFGEEFVDVLSWGVLWFAVFLALPVTRRRLADLEWRWLGLVVFGALLMYALVLLITPWFFPSLRLKGIPERLLLHLVGVSGLLVGAAAARLGAWPEVVAAADDADAPPIGEA